jgi:hypothetical protein
VHEPLGELPNRSVSSFAFCVFCRIEQFNNAMNGVLRSKDLLQAI